MSEPTSPGDGAPVLFDATPPRVERGAAPAPPLPAPLIYLSSDTGALLVSLDEGRQWVLVDQDVDDGRTCALVLDTPPGGLEWVLGEMQLVPPRRPIVARTE